MKDSNAVHRHLQCVGRNLRQHRDDALAHVGRTYVDRDGSILLDLDAGAFFGTRRAALDEATQRDAVVLALDEPPLQRLLSIPSEFGEATVQSDLIVAAV